MHRTSWRLVAALLVSAAACRPEFQLKRFTTNEALYSASLREFQRRKWDNAVTGFDKLTTELPARDTLLPRSYWYLASAHENLGEHLLAAQSFNRLVETFQDNFSKVLKCKPLAQAQLGNCVRYQNLLW